MRWFRRRPQPPQGAPPPDLELTQPAASRHEVYEEHYEAPPPPPPRRPTLWPWLLLLLLLVLGGLGAVYLLTRDDDGDEAVRTVTEVAQTSVPNVVGQRADRAVSRLIEAGLRADLRRELSRRPSGLVVKQAPGAGARVDRGQTVVLTVSRGSQTLAVPAVVGLEAAEAFRRVQQVGLRPRARRVFSRKPVGRVTAQEPGAGAELERNGVVALTVSRGARPVTVPELLGEPEATATARLRDAGLKARIFRVPADDPEGTVVAQRPQGGERAPAGSSVRVNVSEGRAATTGATTTGATTTTTPTRTATAPASVAVPDVVGLSQSAATRRLQSAGFDVDTKRVPSSEPRGRVVAQFPAAGTRAARGGAIRINVSQGPPQSAVVPDVIGDDEATARQRLTQAGFRVRVIREETTDPAEDGLVIDQDPPPRERLRRGATVTLYVGTLVA